jgi:hypothetical protein
VIEELMIKGVESDTIKEVEAPIEEVSSKDL